MKTQAPAKPRNSGGGKRVNVIVTCTKRKSLEIPWKFRLGSLAGRLPQQRATAWIERLSTADVPTTTAEKLYSGDQWQIARSLPEVGRERGLDVQLWVCSAGYGLIPADAPIAPYSATFSRSHADSVAKGVKGEYAAVVETWWRELQNWPGPRRGTPRTVQAIADRDRTSPLLVVGSPVYLRAIQADLIAARDCLATSDLLTIISAGTDTLGSLTNNLLPCDARLQFMLGGALMSLNVRVARRILSNPKPWPLRCGTLTSTFERLLKQQPGLVVYDRRPMSDVDVRSFVREQLRDEPELKGTPLLRRLRDAGFACEQKRFHGIFRQLQEAARGR